MSDPLKDHWATDIDDPHFAHAVMECWKIYKSKGIDYTQGDWKENRLANFTKAAADAGTSVLQAWSVLFSKHLHAVQAYVKLGKVESEPIEGRIYDAINYLILLLIIVGERGDLEGLKKFKEKIQQGGIPFGPGGTPRF